MKFKFVKPQIPPRTTKIVYFSIIFLYVIRLLGAFIDPDMWWHIKLGENIFHSIWNNTLTYTCTDYVWVNHSWLSDLLIYVVHNFFGLFGLAILFAGIFAAGIYFNYLTLKLILSNLKIKTSKVLNLGYLMLFILVLSSFIAIRPQVDTFFFVNFLTYFLFKFYYSLKISYKYIFAAIPFFILWTNLHGGFVIGMALIGLFLLDTFINFLIEVFKNNSIDAKNYYKKSQFLVLLLLVFIVCTLINPFGLNLWREILAQLVGTNNSSFISEWKSINLKDNYHLFYFAIFIGILILQVINKSRSTIRMLLLLSLGFVSLYSIRYILPASGGILLIFFVEIAVLISSLDKYFIKLDKDLIRLTKILKYLIIFFVALIGVIGAGISINFFTGLSDLGNSENIGLGTYPVDTKKYLLEHKSEFIHLKFYNTYVWGGYLEYNLPEFKWFIDGRMPEWQCKGKVEANIMLDYIAVEQTKYNWQSVLNNYDIQALIVASNASITTFINNNPNWKSVYSDNQAIIYIKVINATSHAN